MALGFPVKQGMIKWCELGMTAGIKSGMTKVEGEFPVKERIRESSSDNRDSFKQKTDTNI